MLGATAAALAQVPGVPEPPQAKPRDVRYRTDSCPQLALEREGKYVPVEQTGFDCTGCHALNGVRRPELGGARSDTTTTAFDNAPLGSVTVAPAEHELTPPVLHHVAITELAKGSELSVEVSVEDESEVTAVSLYLRTDRDGRFRPRTMTADGDRWRHQVPPGELGSRWFYYYVTATDIHGNEGNAGGPTAPTRVDIVQPPVDWLAAGAGILSFGVLAGGGLAWSNSRRRRAERRSEAERFWNRAVSAIASAGPNRTEAVTELCRRYPTVPGTGEPVTRAEVYRRLQARTTLLATRSSRRTARGAQS